MNRWTNESSSFWSFEDVNRWVFGWLILWVTWTKNAEVFASLNVWTCIFWVFLLIKVNQRYLNGNSRYLNFIFQSSRTSTLCVCQSWPDSLKDFGRAFLFKFRFEQMIFGMCMCSSTWTAVNVSRWRFDDSTCQFSSVWLFECWDFVPLNCSCCFFASWTRSAVSHPKFSVSQLNLATNFPEPMIGGSMSLRTFDLLKM